MKSVNSPNGRRWVKRGIFAALFGGLVALGFSAFGNGHGCHGMGGDSAKMREHMTERVASKLDLSPAQRQTLDGLLAKMATERQALMGGQGDMRAQFEGVISGSTLDQVKARQLVEAKAAAVQTKSPELIAAAAAFFDSLNPKQQQQIREFLSKRSQRWHQG